MRRINLPVVSSAEIRRCLRAQEGTTAIEYALIASGVSIAVLGVVTTIGSQLVDTFYNKLALLF